MKATARAPIELELGVDRVPMPAHTYESKRQQCQRLPNDHDRMRMIHNVATQFILVPKQAVGFISTMTSFGQLVEAAGDLQSLTSNEDDFIHEALAVCKFQEDRVAMCGMFGIALVPMPKKDDPRLPIRKLSINSGLGQSQSERRPVGF